MFFFLEARSNSKIALKNKLKTNALSIMVKMMVIMVIVSKG